MLSCKCFKCCIFSVNAIITGWILAVAWVYATFFILGILESDQNFIEWRIFMTFCQHSSFRCKTKKMRFMYFSEIHFQFVYSILLLHLAPKNRTNKQKLTNFKFPIIKIFFRDKFSKSMKHGVFSYIRS